MVAYRLSISGILTISVLATALLIVVNQARATTLQFTITESGDPTVQFQIPSEPIPSLDHVGFYFTVSPVDITLVRLHIPV
jgi:hypothetical protein